MNIASGNVTRLQVRARIRQTSVARTCDVHGVTNCRSCRPLDRAYRQTSAECADIEQARQSRRWVAMRDLVLDSEPHRERPSAADFAAFGWLAALAFSVFAVSFGAWLGGAIVSVAARAAGIA